MMGKLGPVTSLMPVLESTTGIFGPWLDMKANPPNGDEGHVWTLVGEGQQFENESRVVLLSASYIKKIGGSHNNIYTHWKPSYLAIPDLPGAQVTPISSLSHDAALAAWRDQNPDYAPDDGPSDEFIEGFRAANKGLTNHTGPR